MDTGKNFFTESTVKPWQRLTRAMMELPPLETSEKLQMWHLGTWFSGVLGRTGLMDGLDGLKGFSQLKLPHDKMKDVKQLRKLSTCIFKFIINVCYSSHCSHDRTHDPEGNSLFQILRKSISLKQDAF